MDNEFEVLDKVEEKKEETQNPQGEERQFLTDVLLVTNRWRNTPTLNYEDLIGFDYSIEAIEEFMKREGKTKETLGVLREKQKEEVKLTKNKKVQLETDSNGRSMSDLCEDTADILKDKDILFYRPDSNQIVEIGKIKLNTTNEDLYTGFREIESKRFITFLEKHAEVGVRSILTGDFNVKSLSPHKASIILVSDILQQALPQIERIFTIPIPIMHKGKLTFAKKGYDKRFSSWLNHNAPEINEEMKLDEAKKIIDKIFLEFPFQKPQDKTNAIAGLLTPFLRGLFNKFNTITPVFFYLGNRERVGKDYCAGITGILYEGEKIEDTPISTGSRWGNDNDELRKKITSTMISGRKRMHFANNKGHIDNAFFEGFVTNETHTDRLLKKNENITLPKEIDLSLSGNIGVTYTPDFANRCIFVHQFLAMENANSRKFDNPNLHEWIKDNRGLILSSLFTLVKNWIDEEKPKGIIPFSSFPNWANVCGGIMESAGYDSPCKIDEESLGNSGDTETCDMKQLFEICIKEISGIEQSISKNRIVGIVSEEELFSNLNLNENSGKIKFALVLKKFEGRELSGIKMTLDNPDEKKASRKKYLFRKIAQETL